MGPNPLAYCLPDHPFPSADARRQSAVAAKAVARAKVCHLMPAAFALPRFSAAIPVSHTRRAGHPTVSHSLGYIIPPAQVIASTQNEGVFHVHGHPRAR